MQAASGLVLVDKPEGPTSHDVVSRMRRVASTRKVGHAGTLDPMATGLLLIGVNQATRLLTYLVGLDKVYEATIRLGSSTTTDDREGDTVFVGDESAVAGLTPEAIETAMDALRGPIEQVPSSVSAIKIDGRRAHQLVREGERVELKARPVTIHEFVVTGELKQVSGSDGPGVEVPVRVVCSSGTYVRALARDLGSSLGIGGHLTALRRTAVGPFTVSSAVQLEALQADEALLTAVLLDPAMVASTLFPAIQVDSEVAKQLREGKRPGVDAPDAELAAMLAPGGELIGLASVVSGRARVVMNLPVESEGGVTQ